MKEIPMFNSQKETNKPLKNSDITQLQRQDIRKFIRTNIKFIKLLNPIFPPQTERHKEEIY